MVTFRVALVLGSLMLVGACQRMPASAPAAMPGLGQGDGASDWHGVLPCADCDGIETDLRLERNGVRQSYTLIETYRSGDLGERFQEIGRWRREDVVLRLRSDENGRRSFVVLDDGRLRPSDRTGRPLRDREGDALIPVSANSAP